MTSGTRHTFSRRRRGRAAPFSRLVEGLNGEGGLLGSRSCLSLSLLLIADSGTASAHSPR